MLPKVLLIMVATTLACTSDSATISDGGTLDRRVISGPDAVSVDAFLEELAEVTCEKLFECCTAEDRTATLGAGAPMDQASCETLFAVLLQFSLGELTESASEGRVRYDDEAAGACLAFFDGSSCTALDPGPLPLSNAPEGSACDTFLVPLLNAGDSCGADLECIGGYCDGETETEPGVCQLLPEEGDSCLLSCGPGLYCASGTCEATKSGGTACEIDEECSSRKCGERKCRETSICTGVS